MSARATELFRNMGEHYKVQIIEALPGRKSASTARAPGWILCRGPHVPGTASWPLSN